MLFDRLSDVISWCRYSARFAFMYISMFVAEREWIILTEAYECALAQPNTNAKQTEADVRNIHWLVTFS